MIKNNDLLIISVFTLITVLAWIIFDVYHAAVTSNISEVQQKLMTELNPKLDPNVLANIRSRNK